MPNEAAYTIELFSRKRRGSADMVHYFRIRATNRQIVASSQGYSRKLDRTQTAAHLRGTLIEAEIVELDAKGKIVANV